MSARTHEPNPKNGNIRQHTAKVTPTGDAVTGIPGKQRPFDRSRRRQGRSPARAFPCLPAVFQPPQPCLRDTPHFPFLSTTCYRRSYPARGPGRLYCAQSPLNLPFSLVLGRSDREQQPVAPLQRLGRTNFRTAIGVGSAWYERDQREQARIRPRPACLKFTGRTSLFALCSTSLAFPLLLLRSCMESA